ncbi:MAG: DNA-directed RNA polymerase subunit omega [Thermoanaerobaculia bacterium]
MNLPDRVDSKFRFVLVSAARAEQMMNGAQPKIEAGQRKAGRIAMQEIYEGAVNWDYGPAPEPEVEDEGAEAEELES